MTQPKLSDYALIGNCRSAALVSKYGSVDWCCLPDFHSPSIFAAILDRQKGGLFSIEPANEYKSRQRYIPETNVVETYFSTGEGDVRLIDAVVVMTEKEKAGTLFPDHEILRIVEGVSGTVRMKINFTPRKFYGKYDTVLENHGTLGMCFFWKGGVYTLLSTLEAHFILLGESKTTALAEFTMESNQKQIFSLSYSSQSPAVLPELRLTGLKRMENTIDYWKKWIQKSTYSGLYVNEVKRSALALKLLTYSPSGAIIAAPTTSLPEYPGGERNWDYRYCWLRDASFTTRVLVSLGFEEEAHAYMSWILHATWLTHPRLQVMYSVFGHARIMEQELDWLSGYRMSRPVRIGNNAASQFQLDVYGEVLDAVLTYSALVKKFDRATKKFLVGLGKVICKMWDRPDNGIWEIRSSVVHHTHSKVMAWVGLDRLIKLCNIYHWQDVPLKKFTATALTIRKNVEEFGYNHSLKSYTRELNGESLDASSLTFSLVGFCDAASDRMASTTDMIYKNLTKNNLVYRYRNNNDGIAGDEGSFGICSFWLAENLAKSGQLEKAITVFDAILRHSSPTGLLSEEIDPDSGELLGNYPQGFTHIGLINAALTMNQVHEQTIKAGRKHHL